MRVFQYIDEYKKWDGMGNDCTGIRNLYKNESLDSFIVTRRNYSGEEVGIFSPESAPDSNKHDIHILHYGGSGYPLEDFRSKKGRKFLRFHNMTPPEFFYGCNIGVFKSMEKFYELSNLELASLSGEVEVCFSDSHYNSYTLSKVTNIPTSVIPILLNYKLPNPTSYRVLQRKWKSKDKIQLCFISRYAPNKKLEDIIQLLYWLKKIHNNSHLVLVGSIVSGIRDYYDYLLNLVQDLNLEDSVEFRYSVTDEDKVSILRSSDLYVSMSEHEGFGIPILEAMQEGIPVLAYDSSAIQETMQNGGILFQEKNFSYLAEFIVYLMENDEILLRVLDTQFNAMNYYVNFPFRERILNNTLGLPIRGI